MISGYLHASVMRVYGCGLNFAMWGRCLFTTDSVNSKIGLCYPNARQGDEVWIMRGANVAFVVRPLEHAEPGCAGRYALIGNCYVHGIMDGELAELEKLNQRPIVFV